MPTIAIVCGMLLSLIGIAGYAYGMMNDSASITALIPFFFGTVLEALGFVAKGNEGLRKHLMHAAVVIALLGFLAPLGRLLPNIGSLTLSAAVLSQIAMSVVCLVFVILAVRSFIAARQNP
jgi:hypothetical protein